MSKSSLLCLTVVCLVSCDSLWNPFQEPNPTSCVADPGICSRGQFCNMDTHRCATRLDLIAGGLGGKGNVDDTGVDARFDDPYGIATDGEGNLFVADTNNNTIRKVVLSTGAVTTIAGQAGTIGSINGIGTAARFHSPYGVATDGKGNLFVADTDNSTIRKIVLLTGAVTTIAGAAGSDGKVDAMGAAAQFNHPRGIAADGEGNLFVADTDNNSIRKIVLLTGAVTTIAGTFNRPYGVATDNEGNLFVADTVNNMIRKIVPSTGAVTTIAGTGETGSNDSSGGDARFSAPCGIVVDGEGSIYIADKNNHKIRKIVVSAGMSAVTTIAGSATESGSANGTGTDTARFNLPYGLALDGDGNLVVAEIANHMIRKIVLATREVSTLAGSAGMPGRLDGIAAAARFNGPYGAAADGSGNLFVADIGNHTIRKIELGTGAVTTIAGLAGTFGDADGVAADARFKVPYGVAADGAGNLFVADTGNHTIRKIVLSTGEVTTIAGSKGMTGIADGVTTAAQFNTPNGVAADGAGNLFIADTGNSTIRKIVLSTSTVTTIAGSAGVVGNTDGVAAARFSSPIGVVLDGAGNLFVTDSGNHTIRKIGLSTGETTTIAGSAGIGSTDGATATARFNSPQGLGMDGAGNLFVADSGNHTIRKIELAKAVVTTIAGTTGQAGVKLGPLPARLNTPGGLLVSPTGKIFITEPKENAILSIY